MMDLPGDELEVDDEEEVLLPLDLTGASDEEILKVFKAMGEEDGIIVTQDGDEITLKDDEADVEYQIQMEEFGGKRKVMTRNLIKTTKNLTKNEDERLSLHEDLKNTEKKVMIRNLKI